MTLLSYQIFHTVAQQGSFVRAAELLHLTPSAISHAVSGMEEEFGFSLFVRTKTGVRLTSNAESLLPAVEKVLSSNENVLQSVAQLNGMQKGSVKLGAFNSVCVSWLPRIITTFAQKFPGIEVEVYQGGYNDVITWLKNGIVDLGFLSTDSSREFEITPLYRDPLICVVPKGFATKTKGRITLEEMRHSRFVIQSTGCDADVQNYLKKYQLQVHSSCHVLDDQSTVAMVASGLGISIMPQMLMVGAGAHAGVELLAIDPPDFRTIGLARPGTAGGMSPAAAQMAAHIGALVKRWEKA